MQKNNLPWTWKTSGKCACLKIFCSNLMHSSTCLLCKCKERKMQKQVLSLSSLHLLYIVKGQIIPLTHGNWDANARGWIDLSPVICIKEGGTIHLGEKLAFKTNRAPCYRSPSKKRLWGWTMTSCHFLIELGCDFYSKILAVNLVAK